MWHVYMPFQTKTTCAQFRKQNVDETAGKKNWSFCGFTFKYRLAANKTKGIGNHLLNTFFFCFRIMPSAKVNEHKQKSFYCTTIHSPSSPPRLTWSACLGTQRTTFQYSRWATLLIHVVLTPTYPFNMGEQNQSNICSFNYNYASQQVEMISSSRIKVCAPFMNDFLLGVQM